MLWSISKYGEHVSQDIFGATRIIKNRRKSVKQRRFLRNCFFVASSKQFFSLWFNNCFQIKFPGEVMGIRQCWILKWMRIILSYEIKCKIAVLITATSWDARSSNLIRNSTHSNWFTFDKKIFFSSNVEMSSSINFWLWRKSWIRWI